MTLATEPRAARPTRSERMLGPVLTIGGLTAATVALHLRDPHVSHSWGVCPLYALTGIYCPGCGGLRGVNDLTDGHLARRRIEQPAARRGDPLRGPGPRPLDLAQVAGQRRRRRTGGASRGQDRRWPPWWWSFWVARNLPGSWLAP